MTSNSDPCQPPDAGAGPGSGSRRVLRFCWGGFRFCVRSSYGLIALVGYILVHLGYIGLPGFLKEPLLDRVREQGLELDYSRIRFLPLRGLVADQVNVRIRGETDRKPFLVQELWFRFDWWPLVHLDPPRLAAVSFSGGSAARAVEGAPGESAALLRLENLAGAVEFVSSQDWRLTWLTADVNGLTLEAMGSLSQVQHLRGGKRESTQLSDFRNPALARILNEMDRMTFTDPPRVELQFAVDGAQLQKSIVQARATTAGAQSTYGRFDGIRLSVDVQPARNAPGRSHGVVQFQSDAARTHWGTLDSLRFHADTEFVPTNVLPDSVRWNLAASSLVQDRIRLERLRLDGVTVARDRPPEAGMKAGMVEAERLAARRGAPVGAGFATDLELGAVDFRSPWITISNLALATHLWNRTNDWLPAAVDWRLRAEDAIAEAARSLRLEVRGGALAMASSNRPPVDGFWSNAAPWSVQARVSATDLHVAPRHSAERVDFLVDWSHGMLRLDGLDVDLPAGTVSGNGWLSATNGDAGIRLRGSAEPLRLEAVLPPATWRQLTNSGIRDGSSLQFDLWANARLPGPTEPPEALVRSLASSLTARGDLRSTNLVVGDVTFGDLHVPFDWNSGVLRLDGLTLDLPSGALIATAEADQGDGNWHVRLNGALDPLPFASLIRSPGLTAQLDLIRFAEAPFLSGELWGNFKDPAKTGASLRVALTNATYRNEPITELRTTLAYTNQQLVFTGTELFQATNVARVSVLHYDIPGKLLHITNGFSTLHVASLVRAIGPKTAHVLAPYQFLEAPTVRVNGAIPVTDDVPGSVVFQAAVPRFQWWYFEFEKLLATVGWAGNRISITNVAGGFYGGLVSANVEVDASNREDAVFQFNASYAEVDLQRLIADLSTGTNRLEGVLSGEVTVLEGHGNQTSPWKGFGNAQLRNGYLWNLPLFGLVSPAFESISPGLGTARFRDGNALFSITNRSVDFNRVELLSPAMRLQMRGPVDFDGRLHLILEAEPLRDVPLFGPLVNLVLSPFSKLMEYDITGTLEKPEAELRHVPSFLLIPLQPFHTLKSVFKGGTPPPGPASAPAPAPVRPRTTPEPASPPRSDKPNP